MSQAVDIFESDSPSEFDVMPMQHEILTSRKRHSKKKRSRGHHKRRSKSRRHSAWTRTLSKHRKSRSPFTYKGVHYHWGSKRGKNGTMLVYPQRGHHSRPTRRIDHVTGEQLLAEYDDVSDVSEAESQTMLSDIMRDDVSESTEMLTARKDGQAEIGPFEFSNLYARHDASEPSTVTVPAETITVRKMATSKGDRYQAAADVRGGPNNRDYHLRKFISRATAKKYHNYPYGNGHKAERY